MSTRGDIIRGAGGHLKRNTNLGVGIGPPHGGDEGDIRVQMVDGSPKLYARAGGQWYGINLQTSNSEGGVTEEFILGGGKDHIKITPENGLEVINDYANVSKIGKTLRIGRIADDTSRLEVSSAGILSIINRQGTTDTTRVQLDAAGNATFTGTVTVGAGSSFNGAEWDGDPISTTLQTSGSDNTVFYQDGIPTALKTGDLWFDTNDNHKWYRAAAAGADQITAGEWVLGVNNADNITVGSLNAARITAGTLDCSGITVNSLTTANITLTGRITLTSTGTRNVCIGVDNNDAGEDNIAIGVEAGDSFNADSDNNVCIGSYAGKNLTGAGSNNVCIGKNAGYTMTTATGNVSIGDDAGYYGVGTDNIFIGDAAGKGSANYTGFDNIGIGENAMLYAGSGDRNIAIGRQALLSTTTNKLTGNYNVAIGTDAGDKLESGTQNLVLGDDADVTYANSERQTSIGYATTPPAVSFMGLSNTNYTTTIGAQNGLYIQGGIASSSVWDGSSFICLDSLNTSPEEHDVIGGIAWRTPNASAGGDSILPRAAIWATSLTSTESVNTSRLYFATAGSSEVLGPGVGNSHVHAKLDNTGFYLDDAPYANKILFGETGGYIYTFLPDGAYIHLGSGNAQTFATISLNAVKIDIPYSPISTGGNNVKYNTTNGYLFYENSDERLKTNIIDSPYGLSTALALKPRKFDMASARMTRDEDDNATGFEILRDRPIDRDLFGFVAQEVEEIMPEAVSGEILKNYDTTAILVVAIKAIQELSAKVTALEAEGN